MKISSSILRSGLVVALASFGLICLLAAPAVSGSEDGGWGKEGSEEQVKAAVKQANEMLHPEPPVQPAHDSRPVPSTLGSSYPELDVPNPSWRYDSGYFFGLSRGLFHEDVPGAVKGVSLVGTVPLDLVGLPVAVLAGFFGS